MFGALPFVRAVLFDEGLTFETSVARKALFFSKMEPRKRSSPPHNGFLMRVVDTNGVFVMMKKLVECGRGKLSFQFLLGASVGMTQWSCCQVWDIRLLANVTLTVILSIRLVNQQQTQLSLDHWGRILVRFTVIQQRTRREQSGLLVTQRYERSEKQQSF